jgi:hypothetical protein
MLETLCKLFIGSAIGSVISIAIIVGVNYILGRKENDDA